MSTVGAPEGLSDGRAPEGRWPSPMGHPSAAVERPPELEPASVSTVVGWPASPASDPVTGQAIAVSGSRCVLWRRWTPEAEVATEGAWTFDAVSAAAPGLFVAAGPVGPGRT